LSAAAAATATAPWRCCACQTVTSYEHVIRWDDEQRAKLSEILPAEGMPSAGVEGRLRAFISATLRICHPNHALLLQARLALVAFGFADPHEPESRPESGAGGAGEGGAGEGGAGADDNRLQRKLSAAEEALSTAERILPADDPQRADLLFQIGWAHHGLAQQAISDGRRQVAAAKAAAAHAGVGRVAAEGVARATAAEAQRKSAVATKAAADAFLRSAAVWAEAHTQGKDAPPCRAAREFADLCLASLGKPLQAGT
jgi:hypothetical protein